MFIVILVLPVLGTWLWFKHYTQKSIVDEAGVIKDAEPFLIDMYFLKKYSGVNFRIVTKKSLKVLSIDQAVELEFARQRLWSSTNPDREVLFFLVLKEKSVRLKFGDALAPVFNTQFLNMPFIEFIQQQSPLYPARDCFSLIAGPNSNTYVQWVIDNSGWDVVLPPLATSADVPPVCP